MPFFDPFYFLRRLYDEWLKLAAEARDQGMIFLLLTGGEPFIRQDFPYLYENLVKMGLLVSINTNASLYNERLRELFLRYPPSRINATLYGGSEETYRNLCHNASFEKVVRNLRSMKEDGLQVRLNVSLTPGNVADMEAIDHISRELQRMRFGLQGRDRPFRSEARIPLRDDRAASLKDHRYGGKPERELKVTIKLNFVKRDIAGETFLVPIGDAAKQYSGLIVLNELAAFLWDLIAEGKEEEELLSAILGEYEISSEEAQADMKEFLDKLTEMGIL